MKREEANDDEIDENEEIEENDKIDENDEIDVVDDCDFDKNELVCKRGIQIKIEQCCVTNGYVWLCLGSRGQS